MEFLEERGGRVIRCVTDDPFKELKKRYGDAYVNYRNERDNAFRNQKLADTPIQLIISLTSWCNLSCQMCIFKESNSVSKEYMSLELVDKIVSEAKQMKVQSFFLGSCSEMLLHPHIEDVIRRFGKVGVFDYWIITNGTLLNDSISQAMIDSGVTVLGVSLDAATNETYKNIRGGNLENVINKIYEFVELREKQNKSLPRLRVCFVEMDHNKHEKEAFIDAWENIADIIDFQSNIECTKKQITLDSIFKKRYVCGYPFATLQIGHDGQLQPCCAEAFDPPGHYKQYNANSMSIYDYWHSSEMTKLRESLISHDYLSCCAACVEIMGKEVT